MTPMKKPEWFQMAEADSPKPMRTIKQGTRIVALVAPLILVGVGFVVAQSNDGGPALAGENQTLIQQSSQKLSAIATPSTVATPSTNPTQALAATIQKPVARGDDEGTNEGNLPKNRTISIGTSAGPIQPPTGHDDNEGFEGEDD